jgi:hypothetical protein
MRKASTEQLLADDRNVCHVSVAIGQTLSFVYVVLPKNKTISPKRTIADLRIPNCSGYEKDNEIRWGCRGYSGNLEDTHGETAGLDILRMTKYIL